MEKSTISFQVPKENCLMFKSSAILLEVSYKDMLAALVNKFLENPASTLYFLGLKK